MRDEENVDIIIFIFGKQIVSDSTKNEEIFIKVIETEVVAKIAEDQELSGGSLSILCLF